MQQVVLQNCLFQGHTLSTIKNFFRHICDLDVSVFSSDGKLMDRNHTHNVLLSDKHMTRCVESGRAVCFLCAEGYRNFLTPILYKNFLLGFFLVAEKKGKALNDGQVDAMTSFLKDIVADTLKRSLGSYKDFKAGTTRRSNYALIRALDYIEKNCSSSEMTLKTVAEEISVNYFHLSHVFKKELGVSFTDYLNKSRVDVAVRLLNDKSLTVSQVSRLVGYDDPSYFGKVFKKFQGVPPAFYRSMDSTSLFKEERIPDLVF